MKSRTYSEIAKFHINVAHDSPVDPEGFGDQIFIQDFLSAVP
jgi:hypothetical protein